MNWKLIPHLIPVSHNIESYYFNKKSGQNQYNKIFHNPVFADIITKSVSGIHQKSYYNHKKQAENNFTVTKAGGKFVGEVIINQR